MNEETVYEVDKSVSAYDLTFTTNETICRVYDANNLGLITSAFLNNNIPFYVVPVYKAY